jgi:hypothetical protein
VYVEIISSLFHFLFLPLCSNAEKWPQAPCDTQNSVMFVLCSSRVRLVSQNFKDFHGSFVQRVTLTLSLSVRQLKDFGSVSLENFLFISCNFAELDRINNSSISIPRGTRSWLRPCATSRNVAGLSPDEADFFNLPNPSSRTMALWPTQPLTEMSTKNLPGGRGLPARKADNLTVICEPNA